MALAEQFLFSGQRVRGKGLVPAPTVTSTVMCPSISQCMIRQCERFGEEIMRP